MTFYNGKLNHDHHNYYSGGIGERGPPRVGFPITSHGDYNKRKLTNAGEGINQRINGKPFR